jgi:hypothetical protein
MPRFVRNLSENGKEVLSMKVFGLVWLGWFGVLAAGWKDLLHATLCQESLRERQGDTQHEGEWFGLARFGLVGLAAGWTDLLHATLRQESVRERQGDTQHEGEWFGSDRFGLVGLAAG